MVNLLNKYTKHTYPSTITFGANNKYIIYIYNHIIWKKMCKHIEQVCFPF